MKKIISILKCFLPPIVALGLQTSVYVILVIAYPLLFDQNEPSKEAMRYMSIIAIFISGIIFLFQYMRSSEDSTKILNRKQILINMLLIGLMGIAGQLFIAGTMTLVSPLFAKFFSDYGETIDSINSGHPVVVLVYVVILAPVVEELIFRWGVLTRASRVVPFVVANVLQAAAFGFFHGNVVQGFFTFLLGLLLGAVYHKYQTIWAPILLHMIFNASTYLIRYLPVNLEVIIIMTLLGGILTGIAIWIMTRKQTTNDQEVKYKEDNY